MTVEQLQALLAQAPRTAEVGFYRDVPHSGCDTCGFGAITEFHAVEGVDYLIGTGEVELR